MVAAKCRRIPVPPTVICAAYQVEQLSYRSLRVWWDLYWSEAARRDWTWRVVGPRPVQ